jgi:hypothetical protein
LGFLQTLLSFYHKVYIPHSSRSFLSKSSRVTELFLWLLFQSSYTCNITGKSKALILQTLLWIRQMVSEFLNFAILHSLSTIFHV